MWLFGNKRRRLRLDSVKVWETGLKRKTNQDRIYASDEIGVYCVADGIGGGAEGEKASSIVCANMKVTMSAEGLNFASRIVAACDSVKEANELIHQYARENHYAQMGTTVAALVFDELIGDRAAAIWIGDSRVYRLRNGVLRMFTRDHRLGFTNILTRAVGTDETVRCDVVEIGVQKGDRFLVCSDGVHGVVTDMQITKLLRSGSISSAANALSEAVLEGGAPDNFSFAIVEVK